MVQLALELLVDRQGELDPVYINPNLAEEQPTSILQQHLSSTANAGLTQGLSDKAATAKQPSQRLPTCLSSGSGSACFAMQVPGRHIP